MEALTNIGETKRLTRINPLTSLRSSPAIADTIFGFTRGRAGMDSQGVRWPRQVIYLLDL